VARSGARAAGHVAEHAPRNPFQSLVASDGSSVAPVTIHLTHHRAAGAPHPSSHGGRSTARTGTTGAGAGAGCTAHVVTSGESLWSIAEHVASTDGGSASGVERKLYQLNRATIGSNPDFLNVGEKLCLPAHHASGAATPHSHAAKGAASVNQASWSTKLAGDAEPANTFSLRRHAAVSPRSVSWHAATRRSLLATS
jgi:Tfp pilus assembly protein FimV